MGKTFHKKPQENNYWTEGKSEKPNKIKKQVHKVERDLKKEDPAVLTSDLTILDEMGM